jgi:hypothetical protein
MSAFIWTSVCLISIKIEVSRVLNWPKSPHRLGLIVPMYSICGNLQLQKIFCFKNCSDFFSWLVRTIFETKYHISCVLCASFFCHNICAPDVTTIFTAIHIQPGLAWLIIKAYIFTHIKSSNIKSQEISERICRVVHSSEKPTIFKCERA